jgi:hypothetical protein
MTALEQMELVRDRDRLNWLEVDPFERWEQVEWRIQNWDEDVRTAIDFCMKDDDDEN